MSTNKFILPSSNPARETKNKHTQEYYQRAVRKYYALWHAQEALSDPEKPNEIYNTKLLHDLSGLPQKTIKYLLNSPAYRAFKTSIDANVACKATDDLAKSLGDVRNYLETLRPLAVMTLEKAMRDKDAKVRIGAAVEILDRSGVEKSPVIVEHRVPQAEIDKAREIVRSLEFVSHPALPAHDILEGEIIAPELETVARTGEPGSSTPSS